MIPRKKKKKYKKENKNNKEENKEKEMIVTMTIEEREIVRKKFKMIGILMCLMRKDG